METLSSFVEQRATDAAERFRKYREAVGKRLEDVGEALEVAVDVQEHRRLERLSEQLSEAKAERMAAQAVDRGAVLDADTAETLRNVAQERVIGRKDFVGLNYLELAIAMSRAVCKVNAGGNAGTGVLVGPRVLMTNNHVIPASDVGRHSEAVFDFQENRSRDILPVHRYRLDPEHFWMTDKELDFSLIGVAPVSAQGRNLEAYPWVQFIATLGKAADGDPVNIIQHPRGGLKQIVLRNNNIIQIPRGKPDFLYYTADTEPGSSGSPCFNNQWELIALHHQAVPKTAPDDPNVWLRRDNGEPWVKGRDDPALIEWIANEGARVSAIVAEIRDQPLAAAHAALRERFLTETPPNPIELVRREAGLQAPKKTISIPASSPSTPTIATPAASGAAVQFQVPLTIAVTLGDGGAAAAGPAQAVGQPHAAEAPTDTAPAGADPGGAPSLLTEAVEIDPDWKGRKGYIDDFLGQKLPLPKLSQSMQRRTVKVPSEFRRPGNAFALDYHNYSVAMHKDRCFAWYSAAVVDGDRRFQLPPRNDKWFIDPRIEEDVSNPQFQCGEELYATARTDRGHLTRYLDVAWGASKEEALRNAHDTLHFTNCCLQIQGFNRSGSRWQGIERFLLEQKAKKEKRRMVIMTGPVFQDSDPIYQNEFTNYTIPIPIDFWKLCAIVRPDDSLSVTAFVLSQKDATTLPGFAKEALPVNEIQITVQELERRTGLRFEGFRDHDHLKDGGAAGTLEVARPGIQKDHIVPIRHFEDIVV